MGLDITIIQRKKTICPKCGEIVGYIDVADESSGGKVWYDPLGAVGYYVPYDQRTEENDWYSKDMTLNHEQIGMIYRFLQENDVYNRRNIMSLLAMASYEGSDVVINANW